MKIYDISQEVFSCAVYPGDPQPEKQTLYSTEAGDLYNLTAFAMCAHNGTHVDAPFHFVHRGKTVDQMDLAQFVGSCFVARHQGDVGALDAEKILKKANGAERILIAGNATVTAEAAEVFASGGIRLLGNEGQTIGPEDAPMQVHLILLGRGIALLEGIVLGSVPEGRYFLVQRESNAHRISAALFGAFGLVVLALRQQGCVLRTQNPSNIARRNVRSSFDGADFCPDEKLDAGNTRRIAKDNCEVWAEIRPSKPMRVRLPLD